MMTLQQHSPHPAKSRPRAASHVMAKLYCWGHNNYGRLGNSGLPTTAAAPVRVGSETMRFAAVTVGRLHTCALTTDAALYCWGFGGFGQLGDGSVSSTSTPTRVILLPMDTL